MTWHISLNFDGLSAAEKACICPKASCGLVIQEEVPLECEMHHLRYAPSIRLYHYHTQCPGEEMSLEVFRNTGGFGQSVRTTGCPCRIASCQRPAILDFSDCCSRGHREEYFKSLGAGHMDLEIAEE